MNKTITGKAYVLGDNIDTDQIIPAEYLVYSTSQSEELKNYGRFALSGVPLKDAGLPEGNIKFVEEGYSVSSFSIIIGGKNFGCGSSREHAPLSLKVAGIQAIVAEGYARIFFRNSVDGGFVVPLESDGKLNDQIRTGDELEIDMEMNTLKNLTSKVVYNLKSPGSVFEIVKAGGLFEYARQSGMLERKG